MHIYASDTADQRTYTPSLHGDTDTSTAFNHLNVHRAKHTQPQTHPNAGTTRVWTAKPEKTNQREIREAVINVLPAYKLFEIIAKSGTGFLHIEEITATTKRPSESANERPNEEKKKKQRAYCRRRTTIFCMHWYLYMVRRMPSESQPRRSRLRHGQQVDCFAQKKKDVLWQANHFFFNCIHFHLITEIGDKVIIKGKVEWEEKKKWPSKNIDC